MKILIPLLLLLTGFVTHKALEEVYDYHFEKGFMACGPQYMKDTDDPKIDAPLTKRFQCTYKEMGAYAHLKYILMRPHFFNSMSDERWYY